MPRKKGPTTLARIEAEREAEKKARCRRPVVREALSRIDREARENFARGISNDDRPTKGGAASYVPSSFWLEINTCRQNGLHVRVIDEMAGPRIEIELDLGAEYESVGARLGARLVYPQNLLKPGTWDLWEIRRDAPIGRIVEDLEAQLIEIRGGRIALGQTRRNFRALEAYRLRVERWAWKKIGHHLACDPKTAERMVRDLLARAPHLPKPAKARPLDCPGDDCPKRRGIAIPCETCPWLRRLLNDPSEENGAEGAP
jgi:hypothetical protein